MNRNIGGYEFKDSGMVVDSCWRISRKTLESAYSWVSERAGKADIFNDRNSVE